MNEQDINPSSAAEGDDIDDVEAHGMREVVAGLSAAAVLAGGAAAIVAQQNQGGGGGASDRIHAASTLDSGTDAAGLTSAAGGSADSATAGSATSTIALGGAATDAAGNLASASAAGADAAIEDADAVSPNRMGLIERTDNYAADRVDEVRDLRDRTLDTAGNTIEAADQLAGDTVSDARSTVRDSRSTVRNAPQTANTAVSNAARAAARAVSVDANVQEDVRYAGEKVDATIVLAGDTVRSLDGTATRTIARIQPGAGMGVDARDASGWVIVSAGGQELARAEVKDGQASVSWEAPSADLPVTIAYSGNDVLNATTVTL